MSRFNSIVTRIYRSIMRRLEAPAKGYQQRIYNNFENLYKYIRKGDVVLIEGRAEISKIIKLFSNSHWSRNAMYVGDELIKKGRLFRDKYLAELGEDTNHLVIEAFAGQGGIASPIRKYQDYNIRVCRPYGISSTALRTVTEKVIDILGKQYDQQNIIDIALMLLPSWLNLFKKRSITACLGKCNEFQVICSGMVAQAFQSVGYPIFPGLKSTQEDDKTLKKNPYGAKLVMRHYSQILPRDFDLSPNFDTTKFNTIEGGKFNYKSLPWDDGNTNVEKIEDR